MKVTTAHDNYPGRYTVPGRNDGGFLPKGPPLPNLEHPNVLHFTVGGTAVRNSEVLDHTGAKLYELQSTGEKHLEMYDAANNDNNTLVARYADGKVVYQGSKPVKVKKFVKHGAPGKTGPVFIYEGLEYEIIQELFYAIVRSVHVVERVAIIYNCTGHLAVEMTEAGIGNAGLQMYLLFVIALEESRVTKDSKRPHRGLRLGLGKAIRSAIPSRKKSSRTRDICTSWSTRFMGMGLNPPSVLITPILHSLFFSSNRSRPMRSKFNSTFEGEDVRMLLSAITKARTKAQEPDTRNRTICAPLAHRTVHLMEDQELVDDNTRPGEDVTMRLSNVFAHLKQAALCLEKMHRVLGQLHCSISPENLLLHYSGKDGEIVYLLNDFDSGYTGRLIPEMYGTKAMPMPDDGDGRRGVFELYTYEDLKKHQESVTTYYSKS